MKPHRRILHGPVFVCLLILFATLAVAAADPVYVVTVKDVGSNRLNVAADLACDDDSLRMDSTRPADVPGVGDDGWPSLVRNLKVTDAAGHDVRTTSAGAEGWKLEQPCTGLVHLDYTVDFTTIAHANWPAPREAGYADHDHLVLVGRAVFVTARSDRPATVRFVLPPGWRAVSPWAHTGSSSFSAADASDLTENLIVLTRSPVKPIQVGGFVVSVVPLGDWLNVRDEVGRVVQGVVPQYTKLFGSSAGSYTVVLFPMRDHGGEAYRASFAYTYENTPTRENLWDWGHTIAHEIFHRWNGYALAGADYAGSQWFQEGFTDYMANLAMTRSGLIDGERALSRLSSELERYSRLTTPLAHPGTRKGPPLYGGGALAALCFDILIRDGTDGRRDLRDLWPALWRRTNGGRRPYTWGDINASLTSLSAQKWEEFYTRYIDKIERMPLPAILTLAGMRIRHESQVIEIDPTASERAVTLRRQLFAKSTASSNS